MALLHDHGGLSCLSCVALPLSYVCIYIYIYIYICILNNTILIFDIVAKVKERSDTIGRQPPQVKARRKRFLRFVVFLYAWRKGCLKWV